MNLTLEGRIVELKRYLQIVWKWRWLIVLCTLLAAAFSYGVSSIIPPVYRASTTLLVRSATASSDDYGTAILNQHLAATYAELLTKRPIIEAAGLSAGLSPAAIKDLIPRVKVWVVPNTSVIRLTVDDGNARLAAELANGIVAVFAQQNQRESGGGRGRDIFVVEPAIQPLEPVAPRKLFNTFVAIIGGCALAIGAIFLIEYLDDTFATADDAGQRLSLPLLAVIPQANHDHPQRALLKSVSDIPSSVIEACRVLYARLQFTDRRDGKSTDSELRTLLITSPCSRKEKGRLAINLAVVMAQAGLKVLLVDADRQEPQLHQLLGVSNEIGLTDLLVGNADSRACVAATSIPNLRLLPSGPLAGVDALLNLQQTAQLIRNLKSCADRVLVDAPPVLSGADVMVLASQTDATILAVEGYSTRQKTAAQAIERLHGVQAKISGVVLNAGSHSMSRVALLTGKLLTWLTARRVLRKTSIAQRPTELPASSDDPQNLSGAGGPRALESAAEISFGQELAAEHVASEAIHSALRRLVARWQRAKRSIGDLDSPAPQERSARDRLLRLARNRRDWALGFEDEVRSTKAMSAYGMLVSSPGDPGQTQEWICLRFVGGRPESSATSHFLGWCCDKLQSAGKSVFLVVWDRAPWHISREVRHWIAEHNRQVKREGVGVRVIACPIPETTRSNPDAQGPIYLPRGIAEPEQAIAIPSLTEA